MISATDSVVKQPSKNYCVCCHLHAQCLLRASHKPCCSCSVFTVYATCIFILHVKYAVYFYISTSRSLCAVHSMAVFCSSLISYCSDIFCMAFRSFQLHLCYWYHFCLYIPQAYYYYHDYPFYHLYPGYLQLYT